MIEDLIQHCRIQGYAEVVAMAEAYIPRTARPESVAGTQQEGEVYLIKSGRFHKIGRSNSAGRREYELAIQLPEKAKTVHMIRTDDPVGIETYWHKRFEAKRKNGEWFELDATDVAVFRRRKFM